MPRSSAWNERGVRSGSSSESATPPGPGTDDRGWIQHSTRRSRPADLPDVPPENLLAKGGLNRHGVSTGRPHAPSASAAWKQGDAPPARGTGAKRDARSAVRKTRSESGKSTRVSATPTRADRPTRAARTGGPPTVADALSALDALAPFKLAADWDNVGLLAGIPARRVDRALVAIDLTDAVAAEALRTGVDLLVIYHPPIFKGIRSITAGAETPTTKLPELLAAGVAIISLHTALDAAIGGTNDLLLDCFDIVERRPLEPLFRDAAEYKLVVFAPPEIVPRLRRELSRAGAGVIGHYGECSFELAGVGTFRGDETTHPTSGAPLEFETVDELRLEMIVPAGKLPAAIRALYANHTYEEPAFDIYPLRTAVGRGGVGMGRMGILAKPLRGDRLIEQLRKRLDLRNATLVGDARRTFDSVTTAAGAFGVRAFRDPRSLVITGEFKHHDALELQKRGVTAIHLGHYESERPLLDYVAAELKKRVRGLRVGVSRADRSPFVRI